MLLFLKTMQNINISEFVDLKTVNTFQLCTILVLDSDQEKKKEYECVEGEISMSFVE